MNESFLNQRLKFIADIAAKHGYVQMDYQANIGLVSYAKNDVRINVYITKMTVGTCINHPTQGKTQLFRKNVGLDLLVKIFENPRVHTDIGYHKKH